MRRKLGQSSWGETVSRTLARNCHFTGVITDVPDTQSYAPNG